MACPNCFGDFFLRTTIENLRTEVGDCWRCGGVAAPKLHPSVLRDYFEVFFGVYTPAISGKTLAEWLKQDWQLFDALDIPKANALLSNILEDEDIISNSYLPSPPDDSSSLERWERFRDELKHENRFFPKGMPDSELDRLRELLDYLITPADEIPAKLFRARVQDGNQPYPPGKMGKPPAEIATYGRANPAGIPYLYLASDERTAVAEIRPYKGDSTCVAAFEVPQTLKIVDLRNPRKTISPFLIDEDELPLLRRDIGFLCRLGEELTRPVLPKSAHLEYLPSQYLCEFIKQCGFDGVRYRSSVGEGVNFALFNDTSIRIETVKQYSITGIKIDIAEIP